MATPNQTTAIRNRALAEIAAGRDHLTTAEIAYAFNRAPQTVRKNYCLSGEFCGVRPIKINGRLSWPVKDADIVLSGGNK
jgi:hypothetical protein